ncbi:MAG: hypothetical protein GX597_19955 [Anaerolineaceae bacterium]|nr:hypothetical protein [Anaerolineaceae bacterium]
MSEPEGESSTVNQVRRWATAHPWQASLRATWLLLNLLLGGASGAFLAWGPLGGTWPLMAVLGMAGAIVPAALWARQQIAAIQGSQETARRWHRALLGGQAAILAGVVMLSVVQLYQAGTFAPLSQDRLANFDRLWRAMDTQYPYFQQKGIQWEELAARYRPQIAEASSDQEYYLLIENMLAELNDGHTGLSPSLAFQAGCTFAWTREMDGQAVVTVARGSGLQAGLEVGSVILSVDGLHVEQALDSVAPSLRVGSSPWKRRSIAFHNLLNTPFGSQREITFQTPAGEERTATLACSEQVARAEAESGDVWGMLLPTYERQIVSRRLPSGLGYIRIPTFGTDLVADFDAALDELLDAPGLVLDLRGNGGGNSAYADQMAGRFLSEPFVYGHDHFRGRLPQRGWRASIPFKVEPRMRLYEGPVVIIVETQTMSSAEQFLASLVDSGRVETVGRRTAGASGNPIVFRLPGARNVRFSSADFRRNDGTPIEGVGIAPDVQVDWTVGDMRQGRDPDLSAAEALLLDSLAQGPR